MDEMRLAGVLVIISALPGLLFGVALLGGLWRPGALDQAANPDGLRRKVGGMVLGIGALITALGLALLLLPRAAMVAGLPYAIGVITLFAAVMAVFAIRKQKT